MARSDDLQILIPLSQLRCLVTAAESVPALAARITQLADQVTALRGLYATLLDRVTDLKDSL